MAWLVALAGLLTVVSATGMSLFGGTFQPRPGSAYKNPIVEFELVLSAQEVFDVLLEPNSVEGKSIRFKMDRINYADYVFMVCYSGFIACVFLFLGALNRSASRPIFSGNRFINIGLSLAVLMLLGDAVENVQLLRLTNVSAVGEVESSVLNLLIIFTRIKWIALFASSLLLGLAYASYLGRSFGVIISFLYCIGGAIGLIAMIVPSARPLAEIGMPLMAIGWIATLGHASVRAWQK